jgi:hypothetical protein
MNFVLKVMIMIHYLFAIFIILSHLLEPIDRIKDFRHII